MKRLVLAALAATVSFAVAPSAHAAQFITITGPSGTFGDDTVSCAGAAPCSFTRTFTFTTPTGFNLASATISSVIAAGNALTNIDFTSVTLNGFNFNTVASGETEFRNLLNRSLSAGATNTLVVNGTTGGEGSFGGTLSFATAAAVPEPATWAMMLMGFGAMGYVVRRRRATPRIRFAV